MCMSELKKHILAIDASTERTDIVVTDTARIIARSTRPRLARGESPLFSDLKTVLKEAELTLADIDCFAVGLGPGSFSGIRSVLSAFQAMALPGEIPLVGISSGAAMAASIMKDYGAENVAIIGDARRQRLWLGKFSSEKHMTHTESDYQLTTWDELKSQLSDITIAGTPDWERIGPELKEQLAEIQLVKETLYPDAALIAELAQYSTPEKIATPIYMHPPVG